MEIKASSIQIGYGDYIVVKDIDVNLFKGQITSIIGPNGSGKSTVLKALTRLIDCKKGVINLNGENIKNIHNREFAKQVAVLPQIHSAPPDFKVKDLVSYGRVPYQKWYEQNTDEDNKIVEWAMEITGIVDLKNKSINACSGGEAQRVWIATVLAQQPEILFLDEPTTYLDISHQFEMMRLIKKLNQTSNMGIVMVLHDLSHALEVSDRIIVLKGGEKYSEGSPLDVITPKMMKEVYGVNCDIVMQPNRRHPLIVYKELN